MKRPTRLLLYILLQLCLTRLCYCALAALSIDLGHQYMKIALVKPGVPMEIVLNRESHRKTDAQIYIKKDERSFGDAAFNMRVRFPENVYGYLLDLLGKKFDHPLVHLYKQRFPYYKLVPDQNRGTVCFENAEGVVYSVEELVGMIIEDARKFTSVYAEQEVKDAVITVPAYFNQAERRALVEAAEIGGVNLLQLMNDNTASGLSYGMFRRTEFNETSTKILIYDMGAMSTTVTVYDYVVVKDPVTNEKNPQMSIIGVGYDRTLGGLEITLRLRDRLSKIFADTHRNVKFEELIKKPRPMNKLLKEAERVKRVLSANPEHVAQIESFDDHDLRIPVSRSQVEELIPDLISRVKEPLNRALEMAELKINDIDHVILMGGGTRFPKIKEAIEQATDGKELKNYLNTDEAVAMGAVYQAAHRSKGFKVKKFVVKELNLYPIVVDFEKTSAVSQDDNNNLAVMRRTLFSLKSPYPQKRKMTFSKHTRDFEFRVNYGDLNFLDQQHIEQFGEVNISRVFLTGVQDAVERNLNLEGGSIFKGAKAHFRMDESGILQLESADISFEKTVSVIDEPSTFQKIGQSISSFFGSKSDKEEADNKTSNQESMEKTEKAKEEAKTENTASLNNETASPKPLTSNETGSAQPTVAAKPKIVVTDLPLTVERSFMDLTPIDKDHMKESAKKLATFNTLEMNRLALAKVKNDLESEVLDIKYKILDDPVYQKVSSQQEQDQIIQKCAEIADWLDEQGVETPKKEYETKLAEIRALTKDISYKVKEATERVKAVESLTQMLNYSRIFVDGMKNFTTGDSAIFTQVELNTLEKLLNETQIWFDDKQSQQAKVADHELPVLTVQLLAEKWLALDREVKYLINKAKFAVPKSKINDKQETNQSDATSAGNKTTTEQADQSKQEDQAEPKTAKDGVEISQESSQAPESSHRPESENIEEKDKKIEL